MLQAQAGGSSLRNHRLVIGRAPVLVESQRDRLQLARTALGAEACQHAGVHARRKENPDRYIRDHMMAHRIAQGGTQPFESLAVREPDGLLFGLEQFLGDAEIPGRRMRAFPVNAHGGAGGQRPHRTVKSIGLGYAPQQVKPRNARRVFGGIDTPALDQGFDQAGKTKRPVPLGVIQRLDAEGIAREEQFLFALVPDAEREHAAQRVHHRRAALCVQVQQDFGVRLRAEGVALGLQFAPQLAIVVDFPVVGDRQASVGGGHGLRAGLGQVDDREAAVREADLPVGRHPQPRAVGAAPDHVLPDAQQFRLVHRRRRLPVRVNSRYPAHGDVPGSATISSLRNGPLPARSPSRYCSA